MISSAAWRSRQGRILLKVLLLRRRHVVTSDQLLDVLWPDEDPEVTRPRLHVRISQLRRMLDPQQPQAHIQSVDGGGYILDTHSAWWVDVDAFEDASEQGRRAYEAGELPTAIGAYEEALRLYRGDLLEEDRYAEWAFAERERLLERYLTLLTELAEAYAQQGRYRRAISLYRSALERDPYRETLIVRLMLAHAYAGDSVQALRIYDRCRRRLGEEMGVEPLPSTQALAEQIRTGSLCTSEGAPAYPAPAYQGRLFEIPYSLAQMPFMGRSREYAWLVARRQEARPGMVLIEGEAGVGKTRLVEEALGFSAGRGARVLRVRPVLEGTAAPYESLVQALRPLWTPDAPGLGSDADRRVLSAFFSPRAADDINPLAARPKEERGLGSSRVVGRVVTHWLQVQCGPDAVLFVDDAPRLDAASLELVLALARTVMVVVTARGDEISPKHPLRVGFDDLARAEQGDRLHLAPLSDRAVAALLHELAGEDLSFLVRELLPRVAGNPLFLVAVLQALFEEGALYVDADQRWAYAGSDISLPAGVIELIEQRLRRLTGEERAVFDAIAMIGQDFNFEELAWILDMREAALLNTLDTFLSLGLITEPRTRDRADFAPAHALYVEVARANLPKVRARRLHGRIADALGALYPGDVTLSARRAHHLHAADRVEEAVSEAVLAGELALERYAVHHALEHIESAATWAETAHLDLASALSVPLHAAWAEALRRSGQPEAAFSHYAQALTGAEGPLKLHLVYQMAALQATRGAGLGGFDRWAAVLESEFSDDCLLGLLRCSEAFWAALRGDPAHARRCAAEGWWRLRHARQDEIAPTWLVDRATIILARTHALWGEWYRARRYAAQALARNRAHDDVYGMADARVTLSQAYWGLGWFVEAGEHAQRALIRAEEAGDLRLQGKALHALTLAQLGRDASLTEVTLLVRRLLSIAEETGDLEAYARGQLAQAQCLQRAGVHDQAIALLDPLLSKAREVGVPLYVVMTLRQVAEARLALGDLAGARQAVDEATALAKRCRMSHEVKRLEELASDIGQGERSFSDP